MRRSFAILMILFFGLGPLTATLEASDDASLPACCRRHGTHHCAMDARIAADMAGMHQQGSAPAFTAPNTCPYYPGSAAVLASPAPALAASGTLQPSLTAQAYKQVAIRTRVLLSPVRTHAGRGPPATA
jgi:hypothetical protein